MLVCHTNFIPACGQKRISLGLPIAFVWASEKETIDDGFMKVGYANLNEVNSGSIIKKENEVEKVVVLEGKVLNDESKLDKDKGARVDVRALALSLQSAKTADDVEELLKDMKELPFPVYSSVIRGFGIDKRLDPAIALVEWLKRKSKDTDGSIGPNLFIYNSLLGAVKQSEQYGKVDKVMEDMREQGIVPNVVTYNTLMSIYIEQGQPNKALDVMDEIRRMGLMPSSVTFSTALLAYRTLEDGEGALGFFVETRDKYRKGEIGKDMDEDWESK
ncbi:protein LOW PHOTOSYNTHETIC EFFICIENCY 1, chloroplastic-like [Tasmannia lanceolata]|uniref:protein LOW PHOTOSYNTHETIC EFFICIENCY 1, chloroplastic-like n=1 Tax=Tasmannia lanceolata TaxID=3420 RepID=UPI0040633DB8